ncbi:MAG: ArsR family transcriptional regulator [Saprospirales bacterium]|nr:MAG: ArsR family transcriptional regulator [Saprospirales bacterium]
MGVTKTDLFSPAQNQLATYARVLAHPARIAILQYLLKTQSCCNSHLVEEIGLAQATISQHLRELKSIGIIQGTIEGVSVNYCIHPEKWMEIKEVFKLLFEMYKEVECKTKC